MVRFALALLLALGAAGCARLFHAYDLAPNGMLRSDDGLRRMLAGGQADLALQRLTPERDAPGDDLLRHVYLASVAHYAGQYELSNVHLHAAVELADERITTSLSRSVLPWEPGRTERLLLPYYGALNYLRLGNINGALIEARRMAFLLQRYEGDMVAAEKPLHATLREFTGAIFEAAGEYNDADVAYRNADALGRTVERALPDGGGFALVVVEHGFVAHRVESSLNVMLLGDEVAALTGGDAGRKASTAGLVAARVLAHVALDADPFGGPGRYAHSGARFVPAPEPRPVQPAEGCGAGGTCADSARTETPYLLRTAWPTFRSDGRSTPALRLLAAPFGLDTPARQAVAAAPAVEVAYSDARPPIPLAGQPPRAATLPPDGESTAREVAHGASPVPFADVSGAVMADFERVRATVIARAVARSAAKLALTRAAENRVSEKDEAAGRIVGILGNAGTALLEQADTRSWHLLPGGVSVVRVPLAAGTHRLTIDADGRGQALDLGAVTVEPGRITFLNARRW